MANHYAVGAVKPWVQTAADEVGNRFGVTTIYGVGFRPDASSDHPKGLALDYMVGTDYAKGDQIAQFMQANWHVYSVQYIIWKQHIWNESRASEGWRAMPDRGSITANHFDHVHVSFQANGRINMKGGDIGGGGLNIPDPLAGIKNTINGIQDTLNFVSSGHNWARVGMFVGGGLLVIMALVMLSGVSVPTGKITKALKAAPKTKFKTAKISRPGGASYDPKGVKNVSRR